MIVTRTRETIHGPGQISTHTSTFTSPPVFSRVSFQWGQRDRLKCRTNAPSYNIFWSEMSSLAKSVHTVKQAFILLLLPLIFCLTVLNCSCCCRLPNWTPVNWLLLQV